MSEREETGLVDVNAWTGHWNTLIFDGNAEMVRRSLRSYGIGRIFMAPLDTAWCPNPHLHNATVYEASAQYDDISPVPVIDPTLSTWQEELDRAAASDQVRLVKLLPGYGRYDLADVDDLFVALAGTGLGVTVQVRIDDPRHQHPLAQVPDVPVSAIVDASERHPGIPIIIGGAATSTLMALKDRILDLPTLYADTSQTDGMDAIRVFVDSGLLPRLLYGSHAPLFMPAPSIARILNDLDDADAMQILKENVESIFDF